MFAARARSDDIAWRCLIASRAVLSPCCCRALQNPRARKIRDNFGSSPERSDSTDTTPPASPGSADAGADASADAGADTGAGPGPRALWGIVRKQAKSGPGAGGERGAAVPTGAEAAGEMEGGQGAESERGQRFRWVARVASRVSRVGKRARGRVARIVGGDDDEYLPGQEDGDL